MSAPIPNFCSGCGGRLVEQFVQVEQRVRRVCEQCGTVAYSNPRVLVNAIVASGDRVLLCRRAAAPAAGRWALPGGFVESGETLDEAAARETFEETGVRLEPRELRLHALVTLPQISEIYVGFLATVAGDPQLLCGTECAEVRLFAEADVPWTELSYADIGVYLHMYFDERRSGAHPIHFGRIDAACVVNQAHRIAGIEEARWQRPASPTTGTD